MNRHARIIIALTAFTVLMPLRAGAQLPSPSILPTIVPEPVSFEISTTEYVALKTVSVSCPDKTAASWADVHLREWYGDQAPKAVKARSGASRGKEADPQDGSYELVIGNKEVSVKAGSLQGVRYALYTLRQLAVPKRGTMKVEGWIAPVATIQDRPDFSFRGMHICWFHETENWEVERLIRLAAYYKLNYVVIESWGTFKSDVAPWYGWPDGAMTKDEIARLRTIAQDLGVTLIPQMNCFGHASQARGIAGKHAGLDFNPEYQPLFEPFAGWNWCLTNPETRKLLRALISEMHEAFGNPPYFHIGCDEATRPSCPECIKHPFADLFLDHVAALNETIVSRGARTMMWHDMLLEHGDPRWTEGANGDAEIAKGFLNRMPRNIVICDWIYDHVQENYPSLDYFKQAGFPVLTCPWDKVDVIKAQARYALSAGIDGILGTTWHHYYGIGMTQAVFTLANAAWNNASSFAIRGNSDDGYASAPPNFLVNTHLRQIGWDMHLSDSRQTGVYYYDIPPEPPLNF